MKRLFVTSLSVCGVLSMTAMFAAPATAAYCSLDSGMGFPIIIEIPPDATWQCPNPSPAPGGGPGPIVDPGPPTDPVTPTDPVDPGTPTGSPGARIAMSNGLAFPYTYTLSDRNIRHYQKARNVPTVGGATYSNIELTYANFIAVTGGELTGFPPITIQAEILYNGQYLPVSFNGQPTATIEGGGHVTGTVPGLTLKAGERFYERVRVIGSVDGMQRYLISNGARRWLWEGAINATDPNMNILGGHDAHDGTCRFVITSGKITSGVIATQGVNYTTSGTVAAYDPVTNTESTVGYTSVSGGKLDTITITDKVTNYSDSTECHVLGGGGFGQNAAIYAASMITGIPNVQGLKAVLIVGDSIARGYGSTDASGDYFENYGIFERAVGNRFATATTALPGNSATAYNTPTSHARMYEIVLPYVTHAIVQFGSNDIALMYSASSVAAANAKTAEELRKANIKVSFSTLIPRTSGSFVTLEGQTPVPGFERGGNADTYNAWIANGTNGLASDWGFIDTRAAYQDPSDPNKWRVDQPMTRDGIHPNLAVGIPTGASYLAGKLSTLGN
jgi:lysophospholipase L1-like esterase